MLAKNTRGVKTRAEKEYIERKALLQDVDETVIVSGKTGATNQELRGINKVVCRIQAMPTADVVEVVRCKDCRLRSTEECAMYYRCNCGEQHTWESDNNFCSYSAKMDKE